MYSSLIECLVNCVSACDSCIKNAGHGGIELAEMVKRCNDCMFICDMISNRLKYNIISHDTLMKCLKLCIYACKKCRNECLIFEDFLGIYIDCAQMCGLCIIECNNIIYKNK